MRHSQPFVAQGRTTRAGRRRSSAWLAAEILLIAGVGALPSNSLESSRTADPIVTRAPVTEDRTPVPDSIVPSDRSLEGTPTRPVDRVYRAAHTQIARSHLQPVG